MLFRFLQAGALLLLACSPTIGGEEPRDPGALMRALVAAVDQWEVGSEFRASFELRLATIPAVADQPLLETIEQIDQDAWRLLGTGTWARLGDCARMRMDYIDGPAKGDVLGKAQNVVRRVSFDEARSRNILLSYSYSPRERNKVIQEGRRIEDQIRLNEARLVKVAESSPMRPFITGTQGSTIPTPFCPWANPAGRFFVLWNIGSQEDAYSEVLPADEDGIVRVTIGQRGPNNSSIERIISIDTTHSLPVPTALQDTATLANGTIDRFAARFSEFRETDSGPLPLVMRTAHHSAETVILREFRISELSNPTMSDFTIELSSDAAIANMRRPPEPRDNRRTIAVADLDEDDLGPRETFDTMREVYPGTTLEAPSNRWKWLVLSHVLVIAAWLGWAAVCRREGTQSSRFHYRSDRGPVLPSSSMIRRNSGCVQSKHLIVLR